MASLLDAIYTFFSSLIAAVLSIFEAAFALLQSLIKAPFEILRAALQTLTATFSGLVGLITGNVLVFALVAVGVVGYLVMNRTRAPGKVKST